MLSKKILKKQNIYRSLHRGTKEMDLLLGNFVKAYINIFNYNELLDLKRLLSADDEILHNWYFKLNPSKHIKNTKVSKMLQNFKF